MLRIVIFRTVIAPLVVQWLPTAHRQYRHQDVLALSIDILITVYFALCLLRSPEINIFKCANNAYEFYTS